LLVTNRRPQSSRARDDSNEPTFQNLVKEPAK
jgi:hypothetical protein